MATNIVDLPRELLSLICDSGLKWHDSLMLLQSHPHLRTSLPMSTWTETDWKRLLMRRGIGKSTLDSTRSWRAMARSIAFHATRCYECRTQLRYIEKTFQALHGASTGQTPEPSVLNREEALNDRSIYVNPGIACNYADMSRYYSWPFSGRAEDPLVWLFGGVPHAERARLCFPAAVRYLDVDGPMPYCWKMSEALKARVQNTFTEQFFASKGTRLDHHILLSSLLATNKPVPAFSLYKHNDLFDGKPVWTRPTTVINDEGVTVLDVMRALTDWEDEGMALPERQLIKFPGLAWLPDEEGFLAQDPEGGV